MIKKGLYRHRLSPIGRTFQLSLLLLISSLGIAYSQPNTIQGPGVVQVGSSYSYSMPTTSPTYSGTKVWSWNVVGGTITSTASGTEVRGVSVVWTTTGGKSLTVTVPGIATVTRNDFVNATLPPPISAVPASRCGPGTLNLSGTPGSGGNTLRWYNNPVSGSLVATGLTYTANLSVTTTFYISSFNTSTGIESSSRLAVTGSIFQMPGDPTITSNPVCGSGVVSFSGTPASGGTTLRWYEFPAGSFPVATDLNYTTPTLSATTTYYVTSFNPGTQCESNRMPVSAIVNSLPSPPSSLPASRCGSGSVTLSSMPGAGGDAVRWYDAPSGGSLLATGTSYTTPALSNSTSFYASTYSLSTGCEGSRTAVLATINALPVSPSGTGSSRCGAGSLTLTASVGSGGDIVRWYDALSGGTVVGTGASFVTPSISSTTTYYISSYNSGTGCESTSARVPVTATINPDPGAPTSVNSAVRCGAGSVTLSATPGTNGNTLQWYTTATGGGPIFTGNSFTTPVLSASTTYYISTLQTTTVCVSSAARVPVTATISPIPGAPVASNNSRCGAGTVLLTATAGADANSVRWYDVATGGSPLSTGTTYTTPVISSSTTYYISSYNTTASCESTSARVAVTAIVVAEPGAPTGSGTALCGAGPVTLSGSPGAGGDVLRWYANSTGGSPVATGTVYITPSLSSSATYYLATYNSTTGCENSNRVPVEATINPTIGAPTSSGGSRCGTGAVTLTATPGSNGNTIRWYASSTGGTPLASSTSYTTPSLSATTTYYISSYNATTNCESTTARVAVAATIYALPAAPVGTGAARCGSGSVTLGATPGANANSIRWYAASTGGTPLATGTSFVTPSLSATTTYYIVSFNTTSQCESAVARVAVVATINVDPAQPTATNMTRCGSGPITLSATPGVGANTIRWYAAATGGAVLTTNLTYTPSLSATKTYYVSSYNSTVGCESSGARVPVTATINPIPGASVSIASARYGAGTVVLSAIPGLNATSLRWYEASTGGSPLSEGISFETPALSAATTYYVASYNPATTCEAPTRSAVQAIIHASIATPSYPVTWAETTPNITVQPNNSLFKSAAGAWDAGAVSVNTLKPSTDGWVEFTYGSTTFYAMAGLSRQNSKADYVSIDYAFYFNGSNTVRIYEGGNNAGTFGNAAVGDRLRITRTGSQIIYSKNGTTLRTVSTTPTWNLRVDVSVYREYMPAVTTSFDQILSILPSYTFPAYNNTGGGISVNVEGGTAPYTYSWSTGETISAIYGKPRGTYTLTVTDAVGRTESRNIRLDFDMEWNKVVNLNVTSEGALVRPAAPSSWDAGASSFNVLPAGSNGSLEFIYTGTGNYFMAGFTKTDRDITYAAIEYALYVNDGLLYIYESGVNRGVFAAPVKGDAFRLAREGGSIIYYQNNTILRSVAVTATIPYIIDVSLAQGTVPVITASFEKKISIIPTLTFPTNANTNGGISVTVGGTYSPVTYQWNPGPDQSAVIANKPRGAYALTVTDGAGRNASRTYNLGYPVSWTDLQNTILNPDNSISRSPGTGWSASAISTAQITPATDGWMEFVVKNAATSFFVAGLARPNFSPANTIDYGFLIQPTGEITIQESGANVLSVGYYAEGDVFRVARVGSDIKYYWNEAEVRSTTTTPSYSLLVDCSLNSGTLPVISASFVRLPLTFYSIANGMWTDGNIWALTEGGPASLLYPGKDDIVNVKGYTVTVQNANYSRDINVIVNNPSTCLKVEGSGSSLTVLGQVFMQGVNVNTAVKNLIVQNEGKINVVSPNQ